MLKNLRGRVLPFILCLALLLGALTALDVWRLLRQSGEQQATAQPERVLTEQTPLHSRTTYTLCHHSVEADIADNSAFVGADQATLASLGWTLAWQGEEAWLSRECSGFCPVDAQKRHLALYQERLAVYAGPLEGGGELLRLLDLPLQAIPARWLAQLTNGGIEFATEEALLMALDNVDELLNEWNEAMAPGPAWEGD